MVRLKGKAVGSQFEPSTKSSPDGAWLNGVRSLFENLFDQSPGDPPESSEGCLRRPVFLD